MMTQEFVQRVRLGSISLLLIGGLFGCGNFAESVGVNVSQISDVKANDMVIKISDLAINGNDLMSFGIVPGPQMGLILKHLLDIVIENPLANEKDGLLKEALEYINNNSKEVEVVS